jgi:hypothetical protein
MTVFAACCPQAANAAVADNACKLQIIANPSQWRVSGIDLFASDPTFASFDLQLINGGTSDCSGRLMLDTQGAPFGLSANDGRRIQYRIIDHATGIDLTPRSGRSSMNLGRVLVIPPGGQALARFDVLFPNTFPTDGTYSQQVFVEMADPSNGNVVAQQPVTLAASVPSSATIALSGNFTRVGGAADVDLGELSQGNIKVPLIVHVKSTRAYQITSTSENGGKLVLPGTAWSIPYALSFDGNTVDPAGGSYRSTTGDNPRVDNLQLGFVITGSTDVQAGQYSDVVTLDIALN